MKQIKTSGNDLIIVEVPKDAYNVVYWNNNSIEKYLGIDLLKTLSESPHKILGKLSELSEEGCGKFVYKYTDYKTEHDQLLDGMYKDYLKKGNYWIQDSSGIKLWAFQTAKKSLISLLQSNGIDISKNLLLIEVL